MVSSDCEFDIGGFRMCGKRWGDPEGLPVLALHGWLDNCASFDFIAPLLPQLNIVALDLAGHGLSNHRNHRGAYNIWQDVGEVFAVADQLEWQQFGLLGHSRGAIISVLAAGTFPQRVSHLGLLDGILPQIGKLETAPETLARSIEGLNQQVERPSKWYPTFADAVKARETGMFTLCHTDALALARRGVYETSEGFAWRYDSKLMARSDLRLSMEQMDAFINRLEARRLLVLAENSFLNEIKELQLWLEQHPEVPHVRVPGEHHGHMSRGAERIADELKRGVFGF